MVEKLPDLLESIHLFNHSFKEAQMTRCSPPCLHVTLSIFRVDCTSYICYKVGVLAARRPWSIH